MCPGHMTLGNKVVKLESVMSAESEFGVRNIPKAAGFVRVYDL